VVSIDAHGGSFGFTSRVLGSSRLRCAAVALAALSRLDRGSHAAFLRPESTA